MFAFLHNNLSNYILFNRTHTHLFVWKKKQVNYTSQIGKNMKEMHVFARKFIQYKVLKNDQFNKPLCFFSWKYAMTDYISFDKNEYKYLSFEEDEDK